MQTDDIDSERASGTSNHPLPISSFLTTTDAGKKSSSSLPDVLLSMREPLFPADEQREGLGAERGGGGEVTKGTAKKLGAIRKIFTKKPKIPKRAERVENKIDIKKYRPEDDLHFINPPTPPSAESLDLTMDSTNLLLLKSTGAEQAVFDWDIASFGNVTAESDSLSEALGSILLNEQSENALDALSDRSSILSQNSLRDSLIRTRQTSYASSKASSNSVSNRNKVPRVSRRTAQVRKQDTVLEQLGLFTSCMTDNIKTLTEAVTELKKTPQYRPQGEYATQIPFTCPKMELSTGGKVSVKDFIIFQRSCILQTKTVGYPPARVLAYLQNHSHCLPKSMRDSIRLCTTLDSAFSKMATSLPNKDIAVVQLKRALTTRPPSGGATEKILSRCMEILTDIEILTYIAPEHRLSEYRNTWRTCLNR